MTLVEELEKLKKKYTGGYWVDEKHPFIDDLHTLSYRDSQQYEKAQEALDEAIEIAKKYQPRQCTLDDLMQTLKED